MDFGSCWTASGQPASEEATIVCPLTKFVLYSHHAPSLPARIQKVSGQRPMSL